MNKICLFIIVLLLSNRTMQAQDARSFSLDEAIQYAQTNHSNVKSAQLNIAAAKAEVKDVRAIGLPQVNGSVDYSYYVDIPTQLVPNDAFSFDLPPPIGPLPEPEPGYSTTQFGTRQNLTLGLSANWLAFDGSYFVGLKAAKGFAELTKRQGDLTVYQLKDVVTKAYLTVLIVEENKKVIQKNITNLEKITAETQAFYDNGLVEQLDVDRLKLSIANLQTELEALNRQAEVAYNLLKFQMYYPLDEAVALSDSLGALLNEPTERELDGEIDVTNRIEYDVLNKNVDLNKLNTKRFTLGYLPSLSAFAVHQQVLQRDNLFDGDAPGFFPTTIVGLKLNVPIFDGLKKSAQIQKSKLDVQKFELQLRDFERGATLEVLNARGVYKNAKMRLENQDKNLVLAERILEQTRIKYKEGVGSSLEMTQAEQELYRTQANRLNALYELVVAKADLDKALGK